MNKYKLPIYNTITKEEFTVSVTSDFKYLLNALNEKCILPSKFTMCYCFNHLDRVIYLACPADYQVYLTKIEKTNRKIIPLLQIVELKEDKFVPKELLHEAEQLQERLTEQYSKISSNGQVEDVQDELESLVLSRQSSNNENEYQKCQICYRDLGKQYYRCTLCLFYQICFECNSGQRINHHVPAHMFIRCSRVVNWDYLKRRAVEIILEQKKKFVFKIHCQSIHESIACDSCDSCPIRQTRYKCIECPDFDLCGNCIKTYHHDKTHNFIQLTTNIEFIKFN